MLESKSGFAHCWLGYSKYSVRLSLSVVFLDLLYLYCILLSVETTNSRGRWFKLYFTLVDLSIFLFPLYDFETMLLGAYNCKIDYVFLINWDRQVSYHLSLQGWFFFFFKFTQGCHLPGTLGFCKGQIVSDPTFYLLKPQILSCYFLDLCLWRFVFSFQLCTENNIHLQFISYWIEHF